MSQLPACIFCDTKLETGATCTTCGARSVVEDGERLWFKSGQPTKRSDSPLGLWGVLAVCVVVGLFAWGSNASSDDGDPGPEERRYAAFDVCTDFVSRRLKAPGTAEFRNFFEADGEVLVTEAETGAYTVRSTVDSENGFGALIRSSFTCTVNHVSGDQWRLVDLDLLDGGRRG